MEFRKAIESDVERIWKIIQQAQAQMRKLNSEQWQNGYPAPDNIANDIKNGYGYVLCNEDSVIAYGAIIFDGEPAYVAIDGKWLSEESYVVVHRLAVADEAKQRGIATLNLCIKQRNLVARMGYSALELIQIMIIIIC
jgi:hypothetical protein